MALSDRFSPIAVFVAHFKALSNRHYTGNDEPRSKSDLVAVVVLYVLPVAVGLWTGLCLNVKLTAPSDLLAGISLLTGGLLAFFTQVASWRDRLSARRSSHEHADAARRDGLDESVAHILVAIYAAVVLVVLLAVASNVANTPSGSKGGAPEVNTPLSALIIGFGSYLLLLLLIVLPALWDSYSTHNSVPRHMGGPGQ